MADNKKPCAPVEAESRDYDVTFREIDPLCAALDELCMALNCWYAAMNSPWQREGKTPVFCALYPCEKRVER